MLKSAGNTEDYVSALRTSTDRARYALYVVIIATVLIFAINHNIASDSWPRRRLDAWYEYAREDGTGKPVPSLIAHGDAERLTALRAEYVKQFVERTIFAPSPLPGVAIDVNDLGLIGGIALTLLMIILVASISREHENLYLGLYKVRLLCNEDGTRSSFGGSRANLLYHALAMTQVLNSPPTLVRWRRRPVLSLVRLAFLGPFVVYAWVIWAAILTSDVSYTVYHIDPDGVIYFELALAGVVFALGLTAWLHTSAMAERWDRAFLRVNPSRRVLPELRLVEWLRIRLLPLSEARLTRQRLATNIIDALTIKETSLVVESVDVSVTLRCRATKVTQSHLRQMLRLLIDQGATEAGAKSPPRISADLRPSS